MLLLLQLCPFNEDNDGFLISKNERKSDRYIINENDIIIITKKICICISSRYDYAAKEEVKEEKIFWRVSLASFRLTKMRSLYEIYPSLFIWPTSCYGYILICIFSRFFDCCDKVFVVCKLSLMNIWLSF